MTEDVFRILVSTDNHLGFAEKDGIRGRDSFTTFEEILRLALHYEVDFILFGGDIFHENRPSVRCIHESIRLLRSYCFGSKRIHFEVLNKSANVFTNTAFAINHLDSNLNVAIPAFTIHGNHDDAVGPTGLSALDILHDAGVLNLFGKTSSVEGIEVNPLLLRKGDTHLAIYGLSAVREERLHRLFLNQKVTFYRPTEDADKWFSLCVVHQNRVRHGPTNYLPENFLPNFLDLIIWGHEHECRLRAEWNATQNFFVIQPGSSVATALSEGEAQNKAVALLEIHGQEFKVTPIPLRTVRPFRHRDVILQDEIPSQDAKAFDVLQQVENTCAKIVEELLSEIDASSKQPDSNSKGESIKLPPTLYTGLNIPSEPLIRLRIDLSGGFESFSTYRFAQRFVGRIANPKDIVSFNHNRDRLAAAQTNRLTNKNNQTDTNSQLPGADVGKPTGPDVVQLEELVQRYLKEHYRPGSTCEYTDGVDEKSTTMQVFTAVELGHSLQQFVNQDTKDAITSVVDGVLQNTMNHLRHRKSTENTIISAINSFCASRIVNDNAEKDSGANTISSAIVPTKNLTKKRAVSKVVDTVWSSDDEVNDVTEVALQDIQNASSSSDRDDVSLPEPRSKSCTSGRPLRSSQLKRVTSGSSSVAGAAKRQRRAEDLAYHIEDDEEDEDLGGGVGGGGGEADRPNATSSARGRPGSRGGRRGASSGATRKPSKSLVQSRIK